MFSSKVIRILTPFMGLLALTAIVVISPRLASAETQIPDALAEKLQRPQGAEDAFDTPFFDAKEEPLTLRAFKGRGLVVNFWATWCIPCVKEMPALDALAAKLKGTGVDVLTISEDRGAQVKVPKFYADKGISNLALHYDEKGRLSRKLGVGGLPTTVLIDAGGTEVGRVLGIVEWNADDVSAYLAERLAHP